MSQHHAYGLPWQTVKVVVVGDGYVCCMNVER